MYKDLEKRRLWLERRRRKNGIPDRKTWCLGQRKSKVKHSSGYVLLHTEEGNPNRYVYEHIAVATQILGRPIDTKLEVVHHINGDKKDNRPQNLLICTRKYHQWLHAKMADVYMREKFGGII